MVLSDFAFKCIGILFPVVTLFIVALIVYGIALLRKKIQEIDHEVIRQSLSAALVEAESVGIDAIRSTNQVLVDELRERSKNGRLTEDEAKEAMRAAKNYFVDHITPGSLRILESSLGPVKKWLEGFLEAKLSKEKYSITGA
ncbi:MAG: hypothetical protein GX969_06445 [Firmicutes bacterium]|nr:hypothetical protein [Bacillota bacterium]